MGSEVGEIVIILKSSLFREAVKSPEFCLRCSWCSVIGRPSKTGWHFIQRKDELKVVHSIAPRCSEKKKTPKKTPQINTFSFKIETLQRDVQTLTGRCLPPVIIFCSASSTSVPTQTRCPAERTCRLKGPFQPRSHRIGCHPGRRRTCRAEVL